MNYTYSDIANLHNTFFLIAGPCVIENHELPLQIATELKTICGDLHIPFIFKASLRKANRTSGNSFTGIGDSQAIDILRNVKAELNIGITTDVHDTSDIDMVSSVVDIIQIPAFLCRQTDLIKAAGRTEKMVNIKKGQFMSAESMKYAVSKVKSVGNENVMLTERGNSFGYNDLVVDMRNIAIMQEAGVPVILDCTHANQKLNQPSGTTSGTSKYIETLAKAGIAAGANGLFIETHPNPELALSDGSNMLKLSKIEPLLTSLIKIKKALS